MREHKNRWIDASGDRRARPRPATERAALHRRALAFGFAVCFSLSGAAWAVDVTDVRVGQHPGFTRVVFELDDAAGYQISRVENPKEGPGLRVELDARTQPAQFSFNYGMVKSLDVKRHDGRLMAQVTLRKKALRLREMTLVDPFRVVIDVMAPVAPAPKKTPLVAAKPKPTQQVAAAPKPTAKVEAPAAKTPAVVTPKVSKSGAVPARALAKAPKTAAANAAAPRAAAKASQAHAEPVQTGTKAAIPAPTRTTPGAVAEAGNAASVAHGSQPGARSSVSKATDKTATRQPAARKTPEIPRVRKPQAPPAAPMVEAQDEGGLAWLLAAGVFVLILGGTAFAVSRRRGRNEFDENDLDALESEPSESPFRVLEASAETDSAGSASLASELAEPRQEEETVELDPPVDTTPEAYPVLEGVPVEAPEDTGIESTQVALSEDLARVLKEIESRLSALEGQFSEFAEWKASVEARTTAQTEELRVQRAAIARTQRAVRQLSRPQEVASQASAEALETGSDENAETV